MQDREQQTKLSKQGPERNPRRTERLRLRMDSSVKQGTKAKRGPYDGTGRTTVWRKQKQNSGQPGASHSATASVDTDSTVSSDGFEMEQNLSDTGLNSETAADQSDLGEGPSAIGIVEDDGVDDPSSTLSKEPMDHYADDEGEGDPSFFDDTSHVPKDAADDVVGQLLYTGARLTVAASMLLIITFCARFKLSAEAIHFLLNVIELHCLVENNFKGTRTLFQDFFKRVQSPVEYHYTCEFCQKYYGTCQPKECDICLRDKFSHFLIIPLISQLGLMFKGQDFLSELNHRNTRKKTRLENIEDVYDGSLYKNHFDDDGFFHNSTKEQKASEIHISLQINTDGVELFRSTKFSVWPVYAVINELKPSLRFSRPYRLFTGLWFGRGKPPMQIFLKPFVDEIHTLYKTGMKITDHDGKEVTLRAILLSSVADAPARCSMLEMMQYNGKYGCPCCMAPGETYRTSQRGTSRIYPYNMEDPKSGHHRLRTAEGVKETAKKVQEEYSQSRRTTPTSLDGIKGVSALLHVPGLDIVRGTAIDYMHCVLLGVMKALLILWFDPTHRSQPWSIRKHIKSLDTSLANFQLPNFVHRTFPSLQDPGQWKASVLRWFLLFYSIPLLHEVLPECYFNHYALLPQAVYLLLTDSISTSNITKAKKMLCAFCVQIECLYGERHLTFNMHSLLHLTDKVQDLGPLWAHSCFFFEDLNGDLRALFHGTHHVPTQIMFAVGTQQSIPKLLQLTDVKTSEAGCLYQKLHTPRALPKCSEEISKGIYVLGGFFYTVLDAPVHGAIENKVGHVGVCQVFHRVSVRGCVIQSMHYRQGIVKRNSFTVQCKDKYGFVQCFVKCYLDSGHAEYLAILENLEAAKDVSGYVHLTPVVVSDNISVVQISEIEELCAYIKVRSLSFVAKRPNRAERE